MNQSVLLEVEKKKASKGRADGRLMPVKIRSKKADMEEQLKAPWQNDRNKDRTRRNDSCTRVIVDRSESLSGGSEDGHDSYTAENGLQKMAEKITKGQKGVDCNSEENGREYECNIGTNGSVNGVP